MTQGRHRFHVFMYAVLRFLLKPIFVLKYNLHFEPLPKGLKGPILVMPNHNHNLDPIFVGCHFPMQMYYVASEHIFQLGFLSKLLVFVLDPISRLKGSTEAGAAMEILRRIRKGYSVCIFAEGNRSFNGLTTPILPATGKLARAAGCTVVTYMLEGDYLTSPRWSFKGRRGRITGRVVNVYTPQQTKAMTNDEMNECLRRDLYEDAYATQKKNPIPFKGKKLAEGLETALFICPKCGKLGTLKGIGDHFTCSACGLDAVYDVYGMLQHSPYETVTQWDMWQQQELARRVQEEDFALADSTVMTLYRIDKKEGQQAVSTGSITMNREQLTIGEATFPLKDVNHISLILRDRLFFSDGEGVHYTCIPQEHFCARKYMMAVCLLQGEPIKL